MIHLAVARLADAARKPLYFIGTLAPDAMSYPEKETAHLRYEPDRGAALAELARLTDPGDDFAEGVLVHLYTDWKWDTTQLKRYREHDRRDAMWFKRYQHETKLASAWIYRSEAWALALWEAMAAVPMEQYGSFAGITPQNITDYLLRNSSRLEESKGGPPSAFYPPEMVGEFISKTAKDYQAWRLQALGLLPPEGAPASGG